MDDHNSFSSSLRSFIESTAIWLRKISKKKLPRINKRKKSSLSTANKIEQLARLLRKKMRSSKKSSKKH